MFGVRLNALLGTKKIGVDMISLAEEFEREARVRFVAAATKDDEFERRFIEHGAFIYFNCAQKIRELQASALLQPEASLLKGQR